MHSQDVAKEYYKILGYVAECFIACHLTSVNLWLCCYKSQT